MEQLYKIEEGYIRIRGYIHFLDSYIVKMSESNLHKNLNQQGWTIRHLVSYILSVNDFLFEISQSSTEQITHFSHPAVIRKAIGMKMFKFFSLRKIEILTFLQNEEQLDITTSNLNKRNTNLYNLENKKNMEVLEKFIAKTSEKIDILIDQLKNSK
jgi:hypothetical protein